MKQIQNSKYLPTKEAARYFGVQGQTMRRGLCLNGHYLGIIPIKLRNGRLLWSTDKILEVLEKGETACC